MLKVANNVFKDYYNFKINKLEEFQQSYNSTQTLTFEIFAFHFYLFFLLGFTLLELEHQFTVNKINEIETTTNKRNNSDRQFKMSSDILVGLCLCLQCKLQTK